MLQDRMRFKSLEVIVAGADGRRSSMKGLWLGQPCPPEGAAPTDADVDRIVARRAYANGARARSLAPGRPCHGLEPSDLRVRGQR